ncbi:MAG: RagB/SusD family nutrient uptake outer membrane protein [Bacteroidales bacterium]|nr:RagB/SusD family nutrient uptake outer membrane protein [Bacteroidales bacterium]MBO4566333.1 RagB/SusD family nutrient uptake outer membrane protein [Bacteroidales bacterium]
MDMKKFIYIISAALLIAGCNFLDFDETSSLYDRDDMYSTYSNIQKMLTNIYGYMPHKDIVDVSDAMRDCGSDDAEFGDPDATVQRYNNGNWSAISTVDTKWTFYNAIRSANEFLESIKTADISRYQYDAKYNRWLDHMALYPYEARTLRAFYLFELARRYGDIPVPLTMLTVEEANSIEKTPFDDVIKFIAEECDTCALKLPTTYIGMLDDEYGRVTKGFAMALKAKALLYAASPLHNPSGDKTKWQKAAQAAKDVMDLGIYRLDPAETANSVNSSETILQIMRSESQSFEKYNFPVRFTMGTRNYMSGTYPTQNLVDAFQTAAGYDITLGDDGWKTDDPDFDITRPYEGRDPRFARAILADGMEFKGETIETFVGGADYSATRQDLGTPTGYYLRRYIIEDVDFTPEANVSAKHSWIISRYAEILLSYAEALNEYLGGPDATDGTFSLSARAALNMVRANAGMPDVQANGQEAFRKAVQREWRVEFAFEDHRFWDVRRWKIGADTQTQIDGVQIIRGAEKKDYSRILVERRTWADRMYLYPIPQSELFCNTNLAPQNPGW